MRRMFDWLGFKLATDNNARWLALVALTIVVGVGALNILPWAFSTPVTNYELAQRELYRALGERSVSSAPPWFGNTVGWVGRRIALFVFGLLGVLGVGVVVYFFPAFWDEFSRAREAVRVRYWDRYGAELASAGWIARMVLGRSAPAGAGAPTGGAGAPLTKGSFLLWEALIDLFNEWLGHRLWGR